MFERIEMMNMARAMTDHAARRQIIVARNVANADTPGFKTLDLEAFEDSYRRSDMAGLRATRSGHLGSADWSPAASREFGVETGLSPNGNSVSLEDEMVKEAETRREHELSLGIYRSSLDLLRTSIGRRG
ncbi:FlgB family protein [Paracoccus sp. (in: a-proteobacteria)]|uniref:FlgB family protein n=1 Tax=Paracoccus sp. TaxID=267 RepID=UPI003A83FCEC